MQIMKLLSLSLSFHILVI